MMEQDLQASLPHPVFLILAPLQISFLKENDSITKRNKKKPHSFASLLRKGLKFCLLL